MTFDDASAVVLFSGGQDSTTCLFWAKNHFTSVHALAFDYGQRHKAELEQAGKIAALAELPLTVIPISSLDALGNSALTDKDIQVRTELNPANNLPNTFVPGRNLLFLTLAASFAYKLGARHLVGGMCETDYSGYPDCRRAFVDSARTSIELAMEFPLQIHTPLMHLDKTATWHLAEELGIRELVAESSHTCYEGNRSIWNEWGYGCGECPACVLRARGYYQAFGGPINSE